jgi:hypothetical protein
MMSAAKIDPQNASNLRNQVRERYISLLTEDNEFKDLISRAVDHTKRTKRRYEIWNQVMKDILQ